MILMLSALVLAGMQTEEPVSIEAIWVGEQCGVRFEGQQLDTVGLEALLKGWVRDRREVRVRAIGDVPYRCIGGTIYAIQKAGVARIGFISEPEDK